MKKAVYTLETIAAEKERLRVRLAASKARISRQAEALFGPPPAANKVQRWTNHAERAFAIYDGVMTGYKLFRSFRNLFRRRKRY